MHPSIREAYERSAPPPAFHLLDPYVQDGKPALSKYTNPDFFLERWAEEEQKKFEELKADWRRRRLIAKKKKQAQAEAANATVKPVTKLKKLCYDPLTGELIVDKEEEAASLFPELQREELPGQRLSRHDFDEGTLRKVGPKSPVPAKPVRTKSRRTMEKGGTLRKEIEEKPLDEIEAAKKPSVSDMLKSDLEKTPGSPSINVNRVATPPKAPSLPVETPVQKISKPPTPTAIVEPAFPPAPPPPLNTTQFAPLVQEPAPVLDQEDRFTDALKSANASLKPTVYPEIEKPTDTRSTLLESIRSGLKNNLRSAQERVIPAKMESEKPPTSVAEILARRVAIEFYSDEEDIDSSDWTE
ncbi:protein SCAR-like [Schistocerca gregaria]|uniref:protein SCAR-like n=1 Tax=Schistocerca gregaria TaxID=7010 RepID=UPI00211E9975|nr:protein SCAR-like [Schistocerca gregaria]